MSSTRSQLGALLAGALMAGWGSASATPMFADIVSIVDESGSMSGEHAWLGGMATSLETGLIAAGLTGGNNYGLTGFGAANPAPHQINVGGGAFGSAAQFSTATGSLVISGSREDGWAGIDFANGNYSFRNGAARNYILVTDEDRDNTNAALSYASVLASMTQTKTLLNAVVNASFACGAVTGILGVDSAGNGYLADGAGGYTTLTGCAATGGSGTTVANYVDLALATGGAAWDLNRLRSGGLTAVSFTSAFVDIKVREISQNDTPEPGTLVLAATALLGLGAARRRRR